MKTPLQWADEVFDSELDLTETQSIVNFVVRIQKDASNWNEEDNQKLRADKAFLQDRILEWEESYHRLYKEMENKIQEKDNEIFVLKKELGRDTWVN